MSKFITGLLLVLNHPQNRAHKIKALAKLVFWKLNQVTFRLPMIVTFDNGVKCICYPDSSYAGLVMYTGYPEYKPMRLLEESISANDVVIDVGANIGAISLIASTKTKKPIYAFEADPRVLPRLKENISLNNLDDKIRVIEKAVSHKSGLLSFAIESQSEVSHIHYTQSAKTKQKLHQVKTTALDTFLAKHKLSRNLVVKIDVEGAEMLVFKGMKKALKKHQIKMLVFEVNPNVRLFGSKPEDLLAFLSTNNYDIFSLEPVEKVTAFDQVLSSDSAINLVAFPKGKSSVAKITRLVGDVGIPTTH